MDKTDYIDHSGSPPNYEIIVAYLPIFCKTRKQIYLIHTGSRYNKHNTKHHLSNYIFFCHLGTYTYIYTYTYQINQKTAKFM